MKNQPRKAKGFSLIEVTVALLVFSLGILAILALFPSGVVLSQESQAETYVTDFAEMVFNSVAVELERDRRFWGLSGQDYTDLVRTYPFVTTRPLDGSWPTSQYLQVWADATWRTNAYVVMSGATPYTEVTLRYTLTLRQDRKIFGFLKQNPKAYTLLMPPYYPPENTQRLDRAVDVKNYYPINDCVIMADLAVRAGPYGSTQRDFARYYYNWNNIKRQ